MEIVVPDDYKDLYVEDKDHPILKIPNPVLRQKSVPVAKVTKKTLELIDRMIKVCKEWDGAGLAAPQLGVLERVIVVMQGWHPLVLINPEIIEAHDEASAPEGCMSIPGLYGNVRRPYKVRVKALDRKGRSSTHVIRGVSATAVHHEVDHLNGVLFIDRADPTTFHWHKPRYADNEKEM